MAQRRAQEIRFPESECKLRPNFLTLYSQEMEHFILADIFNKWQITSETTYYLCNVACVKLKMIFLSARL